MLTCIVDEKKKNLAQLIFIKLFVFADDIKKILPTHFYLYICYNGQTILMDIIVVCIHYDDREVKILGITLFMNNI